MKDLFALAAIVIAVALGVVALAFYNTWTVHHMDIVVWAFSLTCLAVPICAAIATYMIVRAKLDDKAEAAREKQILTLLQEQNRLSVITLSEQRQQTEGFRQERLGRLLSASQPQQIAAPENMWVSGDEWDDDEGGSRATISL